MKLQTKNIAFIFLIIMAFTGCQKPKKYSDIPAITFSDFILKDTIDALDNPVLRGTLVFDFVDGDGDIGLMENDTTAPYDSTYFYNLYITEYYAVNDSFVESNPVVPYHYRIPYVAATGQNKTLKGSVKINIDYNYPLLHDTVYYTFYIYDRAFHQSNVEKTPVTILPQ